MADAPDPSSLTGSGYEVTNDDGGPPDVDVGAAFDKASKAASGVVDQVQSAVQAEVDALNQTIADAEARAAAAAAAALRALLIAAAAGVVVVGGGIGLSIYLATRVGRGAMRGIPGAAQYAPYILPLAAPQYAALGPLAAQLGGGARPPSDPLAAALLQAQALQRALPPAYAPPALPAAPMGPSRVEQLLAGARPGPVAVEVGSFRGRVPTSGPLTARTG
jgi:hypothetical protein